VPSILVTYSQKTSRVFQFEEFCLTPETENVAGGGLSAEAFFAKLGHA
jgi:hypothetical protein